VTLTNVREMQITADRLQKELLELISGHPDETTSNGASSVCEFFSCVVYVLSHLDVRHS
jgi:hypothetical protein